MTFFKDFVSLLLHWNRISASSLKILVNYFVRLNNNTCYVVSLLSFNWIFLSIKLRREDKQMKVTKRRSSKDRVLWMSVRHQRVLKLFWLKHTQESDSAVKIIQCIYCFSVKPGKDTGKQLFWRELYFVELPVRVSGNWSNNRKPLTRCLCWSVIRSSFTAGYIFEFSVDPFQSTDSPCTNRFTIDLCLY